MQALLHGSTTDRILPNTHVALMGPTDRGDAISGIIKRLGWGALLAYAIGAKPGSRCSGYRSSINSNQAPRPRLSEDGTKANPLTDLFYSNILLCRALLLS